MIIVGLPLGKWYPELGPGASLWCATEVTKRVDMDFVAAEIVTSVDREFARTEA
jgi:glycine dehydrogenase subunit 1